MSESKGREYALGTNDAEIVRLGLQHKMWSAAAFSIWERAGIRAGHTVLDLGCGPGYTSRDLAGIVTPKGKVVAVDESARFIEHLKARPKSWAEAAIDARIGDVQQLDLPADSLDAAYQRWVLCFVKDPEAVIRGVAAALKPGGVFVSQDYLHYEGILLAPPSKPFERFVSVVADAWRGRGGDTEIGMRLPAILARHGMKTVEISPLHRIARPGSPLWTWPTIFIETYGPKLVEEGRLTPAEHEALVADWNARASDPSAYFVSPPMVDIIAVKPHSVRRDGP
jgi:SAM-dependent methyltransferase